MLPIYFVIGLINIFSQHHNYGIDIKDPNFDIRVRRSLNEGPNQKVFINKETILKNRVKRYYEKTRITNNVLPQYSYDNNIQNTRNNGNRYDIFNPNWNYLFNKTKRSENSKIINSRPILNSYPYGYPPGYGPKAAGNERITTTTGYRNQESNTPYFYNYQNPDGRNFAGYVGYPDVLVTPVPYGSRYSPTPNAWNNGLAPYPPTNTQKPMTYQPMPTNNLPTSYSTYNSPGNNNLPYTTNTIYNNNFNTMPKPFVKDNLAPYAPNFNNGSYNFENGTADFNNGLANLNNGTTHFENGSVDFNNASVNFDNGTLNFNNGTLNFNNESYTPINNTITTVTTTETIVTSCIIVCTIQCPQFMKSFGRLCVPKEVDDDY